MGNVCFHLGYPNFQVIGKERRRIEEVKYILNLKKKSMNKVVVGQAYDFMQDKANILNPFQKHMKFGGRSQNHQ